MKLQRAVTGIRANQWWHFKVNIFVAFALLAYRSLLPLPNSTQVLLGLCYLLALLPGATYVSLINDLTDYQQDRMANKMSGIDLIGKNRSLLLIFLSIGLGILFTYFLPISNTAKACYAAAWISFSCYSIRPIRLKNRGVWGILADASGAHLFPVLFLFAAIQQHAFSWLTAGLIGLTMLCFGFRGILWHQFADKKNDQLAGVVTLVTTYNNTRLKQLALVLCAIEGLSLITYFIVQHHYFLLGTFALYAVYLVFVRRFLHVQWVVSEANPNNAWVFIMGTFYQFFLPMALLVSFGVNNPVVFLAIPLYLWLFPVTTKQIKEQVLRSYNLLLVKRNHRPRPE